MISGLNKALSNLAHALRGDTAGDVISPSADSPISELTPNWHGDHWQNLLSSPMDARRYILEDWTDAVLAPVEELDEGRIDSFSGRPVRQYS